MRENRKWLAVLLCAAMLLSLLAACGKDPEPVKPDPVKSEASEPVPSESTEPVPSESAEPVSSDAGDDPLPDSDPQPSDVSDPVDPTSDPVSDPVTEPSDDPPEQPPETPASDPVAVTGVKLNRTSATVVEGKTLTLTATVSPADASNKSVIWSSSDESVVTVNNGTVSTTGVGTAVVTVTTTDGSKTASCTVTVTPSTVSVTGVRLDKTSLTLSVGAQTQLTASVQPANASDQTVIWSSSDNDVVTVSDGLVTAIGAGTAKITVTTKDGSKTASCVVSVNSDVVSAESITLSSSKKTVKQGSGSFDLAATVSPANATDKTVVWTTSDSAVATVNQNGRVSVSGAGVATVTATTADGLCTATCTVNVTPVYSTVAGVSLDKTDLSMTVGDRGSLGAAVSFTGDPNGVDDRVYWSSANESVVRVSTTGQLLAVGEGQATVTATSVEGKKTASCSVTVSADRNGIDFDSYYIEMRAGGIARCDIPGVKWSSSDTSVCTVTDNGEITGVSEGEATLTASNGESYLKIRVVVYTPFSDIVANADGLNMLVGDRTPAPLRVLYASDKVKYGQPVFFESSDPSVCTVDANGIVTAVGAGSAELLLKTPGVGISGSIAVTVLDLPTLSVRGKTFRLGETRASATAKLGAPQRVLTVRGQDTNGRDCTVTECVYHDGYRNLTILSFMSDALAGVFSTDEGVSYAAQGGTVQYGELYADSVRDTIAPNFELTTAHEIMRGSFLKEDASVKPYKQHVFIDVLNEYKTGETFVDDHAMKIIGMWIATNDLYCVLDTATETDTANYEFFVLTNAVRVMYGCPAVAFHDTAADVAEAHCRDMNDRDFFDHVNPDGQTPSDRIKNAGIVYSLTGENIAMGQSNAYEALFGLLNSSAHRDNILTKEYEMLGTGVYNGKTQYYAQEFLTEYKE